LSSRRRPGSRQKAARHARRGPDYGLRRSDEGGYPIFPGQQCAQAGIPAKTRPALREYSCTPPRSRRLPLRERGDERTAGGCGERVARETHVGDLERQRTTTQRLLEAITKPVRFRRAARENDRQRLGRAGQALRFRHRTRELLDEHVDELVVVDVQRLVDLVV